MTKIAEAPFMRPVVNPDSGPRTGSAPEETENRTPHSARMAYAMSIIPSTTEPMTEEQGARAVEIEALLEPLQEQLESGTLADEAYIAIEEQYDALAAELHALENRPVIVTACNDDRFDAR